MYSVKPRESIVIVCYPNLETAKVARSLETSGEIWGWLNKM